MSKDSTLPDCVILASTTLHLMDAIVIAKQFPSYDYHFLFIDQKSDQDIYFQSLRDWKKSPFKSSHIFVTDKSKMMKKIQTKRESIHRIFHRILEIDPDKIIVGNDRKNEIAAVISAFKERKKQVSVGYMDDGIHSYLIEKSSLFKYSFMDNMVKKIVYGANIHTPRYIGCSEYIEDIYLYRPELRHPYLQNKKVYGLEVGVLQGSDMKELIAIIMKRLNIDISAEMSGVKHIVFLPHPKELGNKLDQLLDNIDGQAQCAFKLHPRDLESHFPLEKRGMKILPSSLSAEMLFLSGQNIVSVFGFGTTALLMAAWLCQDLKVYSIVFDQGLPTDMDQLMVKNDIRLLSVKSIRPLLKE